MGEEEENEKPTSEEKIAALIETAKNDGKYSVYALSLLDLWKLKAGELEAAQKLHPKSSLKSPRSTFARQERFRSQSFSPKRSPSKKTETVRRAVTPFAQTRKKNIVKRTSKRVEDSLHERHTISQKKLALLREAQLKKNYSGTPEICRRSKKIVEMKRGLKAPQTVFERLIEHDAEQKAKHIEKRIMSEILLRGENKTSTRTREELISHLHDEAINHKRMMKKYYEDLNYHGIKDKPTINKNSEKMTASDRQMIKARLFSPKSKPPEKVEQFYPFQPKLSKMTEEIMRGSRVGRNTWARLYSSGLEQQNRKRIRQEIQKKNERRKEKAQDKLIQLKLGKMKLKKWNKMLKKSTTARAHREDWLQQKRETAKKREMQGCSFKPNIGHSTKHSKIHHSENVRVRGRAGVESHVQRQKSARDEKEKSLTKNLVDGSGWTPAATTIKPFKLQSGSRAQDREHKIRTANSNTNETYQTLHLFRPS